ncbi:alcohol dehydrogenase [Flexivirga endophytica]|uniref:Alcohol dehydrogenase n=1 Tax=Flexivirga endophytica TaxID=1849103 RepID=A0A916WPW1_9MICO|nr:zinc-binding dehydrogenase [Flexivirga endophytica]GGB18505.1 alcohol dehydrogenase [Flexivirga endophytica]GHB37171.1 alcohol dehydrogenase [Flexivirga endophytica]
MWAQQLVRPGVFEQVDAKAPDPAALHHGETLLRVEAGAICGSDLPYFRGETCTHFDDAAPLAANVPGFPLHEVVGEVVASDDPALPVSSRAVGWATRFSALAEYTVTDSDSLMAVPDELDSATALTLQPLACVLETVRSLGPVDGLRVAVLGLGPFGLLFCHTLSAAGAAEVVGVDRLDRSAIADAFGINTLVHSATGRWARSLADDDRPDLIIEAVGHQTATLSDAVEAVAQDGRIFCFGVPDEPVYPLPMQELFRKHVTLFGGIVAERRRCLESALAHQRRFPELQKQLVSHTFDFTDAQLAFDLAAQPSSGRLKVQLVR